MNRPIGLVLGFSIHGLAVARSLTKAGIEVHAFAQPEARESPTTRTKFATVHTRAGLNDERLLPALRDFAVAVLARSHRKAVIFPTSDRMVKTIAENWDSLSEHYLISWAHCRATILSMQAKSSIPGFCERASVPYPASRMVESPGDCERVSAMLRKPMLIKPCQPLSSFKALLARDTGELRDIVTRFGRDLPFVAQEWIEGGDGALFACTAYLDRGRIIQSFVSQKLAAVPPGLGQGIIFAPASVPEVRDYTSRFLRGLGLSGPVAVEYKRDPANSYLLIEPNVGRTEYCVDMAIQCGFDLPLIEYHHACGGNPEDYVGHIRADRVWFDTDKDPLCFLRHRNLLKTHGAARSQPIFPYLGHGDIWPMLSAAVRLPRDATAAAIRHIRQRFAGQQVPLSEAGARDSGS